MSHRPISKYSNDFFLFFSLVSTFEQFENLKPIFFETPDWDECADSHLFQQRSGLLWNRLGYVESGVTTDSRWMAPQQRLFRGKEKWKKRDRLPSMQNRKYTDTHRAQVSVGASELNKQEETKESEHLKQHWYYQQQSNDVTTVAHSWNCCGCLKE